MSKAKQEMFEVNGKEYHADPDLFQFLVDAFGSESTATRVQRFLKKEEIKTIEQLYPMGEKEMIDINGISKPNGKSMYRHMMRLKAKGDVLSDYNTQERLAQGYRYLPTGSMHLDQMLTYANGNTGWRSRTLIELYGKPSHGKTQICITAALICLRPENRGGWNKGVVYIDSEGAFDVSRFRALAKYWGVDDETLRNKFLYAYAPTFDEVEIAVDTIFGKGKQIDLGLVVVDSIMDPLKAQYFVGGEHLKNLQPRQQHLKKVLDKLKSINSIYNSVAIYTNHVRAEINKYGNPEGPQGGAVLGHASDIRISLTQPTKNEVAKITNKASIDNLPIKVGRAKIVDCGFLPELQGYFLIGPMGIADSSEWKQIFEQVNEFFKVGHINKDSTGELIERDDVVDTNMQLQRNKELLYGKKS